MERYSPKKRPVAMQGGASTCGIATHATGSPTIFFTTRADSGEAVLEITNIGVRVWDYPRKIS